MFANLLQIVTSTSVLWLTFGVVLGLIFGAIPGLTATLAVILLIPFTYSMDVVTGMATLIGIYVGGISGGLVSAIMINMPGTPSSVATTWDGFPLAKQGKAGKALGVSVTSSFIGTMMSWAALITIAPLLSRVALMFGPMEYTAAMLFGFSAVVALSGDSVGKGAISALIGLALMVIGHDPISAAPRASFGNSVLAGGLSYTPALIGLFVISEILIQMETIEEKYVVPKQELKDTFMTVKELKDSFVNFIRAGLIGIAIGILPGIGATFSNIVCYDQVKKASKDPDSFGKGNIQGLVASETGNNATIGGALIPMLSLGIPGDGVTAALMGGLMIKGITPGPLLVRDHPQVVFSIFNSVLVSSFVMLIFMYAIGLKIFPRLLRLPKYILLPAVLIMCLSGAYNISFSIRDVWVAVFVGFLGYGMDKFEFPKTPVVITMVLGKSFESYFRNGLAYFDGSLLPLVTRPFALFFVILTVFSIAAPFWSSYKKKKAAKT